MRDWSPEQWGEAAFAVFSAFYSARLLYLFVAALIGFERVPFDVNVTITRGVADD
jgi:hypothetical protein